MEEIFESEKLNCIRNEMTHLWGSIFATSGGVVALVLSDFSMLKLFFIIFGTLLSLIMINAYFIRRTEVMNILKNMKHYSKKEYKEIQNECTYFN